MKVKLGILVFFPFHFEISWDSVMSQLQLSDGYINVVSLKTAEWTVLCKEIKEPLHFKGNPVVYLLEISYHWCTQIQLEISLSLSLFL